MDRMLGQSVRMHKAVKKSNDSGGWETLSLEQALSSLETGIPLQPSVEDFAYNLRRCTKERNLACALRLHAHLCKTGLECHRSLGNHLVSLLVEVESMCDAQNVFDRLVYQSECSWNSLITGYIKCGELQHALIMYQKMQEDTLHPNAYTFVALLKACAELKDLERGHKIHAEIAREGLLERDLFVGNALVDMYAKCGLLAKAHGVFNELPVRDVVSWTALITGYTNHESGVEALTCLEQMKLEGVCPNAVTYVCILKACGLIGAIDKGREIHAEIARKGLLERDLVVGNALVDMYTKCGFLAKAQEVFDKLPVRDVVSWNALMAGYAKHEHGEEALNCLEQMQLEGVSPNAVTFVCSLKACATVGATDKGREIHAEIARKGLLERDLVLGNVLVDMYAKCGLLAKAQEVFDKLSVRDVVSWTALIAGYVQHKRGEEALNCFERMQLEGVSPNTATFVCGLEACGSMGATDRGREIHAEIARKGLVERDIVVGNALVDMYAKCGLLAKAQELFDKLPVRDLVSWTALITGYVKHDCGEEALNCFEQMQTEGVSPDAVAFVCSLKACGCIGATDKGTEIHAEIAKKGLLERDHLVGNALVDMYAKCGLLAKAQEVFDELPLQGTAGWSALIAGYAQLGESDNVFHIFDKMKGEGEKPDMVTFVGVLNACSHAGLVDKGQVYFEAMSKAYGINPTLEHHTCMVDLLSRAGHLDRAVAMIKRMPLRPDLAVWHTILDACRKWGNVELGRTAFVYAVLLNEKDATAYVCMSNIYADAGMPKDANKVEAMKLKNTN